MLMSTILSVLIMKVNSTMKNSWETMSMLITTVSLLLVMKYPLINSTCMMSKNLMLDSMSLLMLALTGWITSLMIMASYMIKTKKNSSMFLIISSTLMMILIMCFSANNMLMFYIWFEASLIPTMLLIIIWGNQPERKTASMYIMMYTVTASIPMLTIILKMLLTNFHASLMLTTNYMLPLMMSPYLSWAMLMMPFMVKIPLFSLHMWLPKAHVEAPVAGSMVLAAILLKLGGYGMVRLNKLIHKQILPIMYTIISIAIIGAIITNMMCLRQTDLKALIAYSSVGHMGLLIMSTMPSSKIGQYSSLMIMVTHGLTSSLMFFLTNIMYEKTNSRNIMLMNGLIIITPINSLMWMLSISSNMALPPSLNLTSEIMAMMSAFFVTKSMLFLLMITNLLTTTYSLYLYSMINHGNQLKMSNSSSPLMSINMTTTVSHTWPLIMLSAIPTKLMIWC